MHVAPKEKEKDQAAHDGEEVKRLKEELELSRASAAKCASWKRLVAWNNTDGTAQCR